MAKTKTRQPARDGAEGADAEDAPSSAKASRKTPKRRTARDRQIIMDAAYGFLNERAGRLRVGARAGQSTQPPLPAPATPGRASEASQGPEPPLESPG